MTDTATATFIEIVHSPAELRRVFVSLGLASAGEPLHVTALPGGVSSGIWRVDLASGSYCLKQALPRLKVQATPITGMDVGYAPRTGMLVYHLPKGSRVRKGQAVCEVIDPADSRGPKARTQVLARTDGILFSRKLDGRLAWPGANVFRIAGAKPLAHRKGMTGLDD